MKKKEKKMLKWFELTLIILAITAVVSGCKQEVDGQAFSALTNEISRLSRKVEECGEVINAQRSQVATLQTALEENRNRLANMEVAISGYKSDANRTLLAQNKELTDLATGVASNMFLITTIRSNVDTMQKKIDNIEGDTAAICKRLEITRYRW